MSYYHDPTSQPSGDIEVRSASQEAFTHEHDLFERIFSPTNVNIAWKQVKANKGAPGVDLITIEQFPEWAKAHWLQCRSELMQGNYQPSPVKRVEIDKPDGGKRQLGIPTVLDRVIQQAITQVLSEMIDPSFSDNSFGFRPKRRAHDAIKDKVQRIASTQGVPQGGPLSPLLSNVMLDDLDKELESRNHRFARYADDFIILAKSERAGKRVLQSISRYLETRFKVRKFTNRNWGVSTAYQIYKFSQFLRGWIAYYGIANCYQHCVDLDGWIKRRVRMCYWRQWRKPRTKVRRLMKLGVHVRAAVACGITSKGPWCSSKTPGIQQALNDKFLAKAGLHSLREGWIKVHYPNG